MLPSARSSERSQRDGRIPELLADFPYLEVPDIREALAFAANLAEGRELGQSKASDNEICASARAHAEVILSNDLDFPRILALAFATGPSLILLGGEPLVPEDVARH